MEQKYLQMKGICKRYPGVKALDEVTIEADEGEVLALLGENGAGKSTLMNVLGGIVKNDAGEIVIDGKVANIQSVRDAQKQRIAFIHQELSLFQQKTVEENLFVDAFPMRKDLPFLIDKKEMTKRAKEIFLSLDMDIPVKAKVSSLSISHQQIVEIAGALLKDAKIIILDEPSSSLTNKEREKLNEIINKLRSEKKIIIYITHDIDAALMISDRVYVLRDGKNSGDGVAAEMTKEDVLKMMIGEKYGKEFYKTYREIADRNVLELRNISNAKLKNVSLNLRQGEILGMYGLIGSGRTEVARALFGLDPCYSGEIYVMDQQIKKPTPKIMKGLGIGYLTENRREEGLFLELAISHNISVTALKDVVKGKLGTINQKKELTQTEELIRKLQIATPSPKQLAGRLSGGNQQKVVISKWLHLNPQIFIMDEPTRGIDVGAKSEIYKLIDQIASSGVSVILISSEIEEIMGISDRILIMRDGSVQAEFDAKTAKEDDIIKFVMG